MNEEQNKIAHSPENKLSKPVEKNGFPSVPPGAAMEDLRFIVKESIRLGGKAITELDRLLSALRK
ncbi:MAG: hypothetical protein FJY09_00060 [Chlorobi bacterium]|nr:hypothetical protein [Chlorobiota bacterium]